MISQLQEQLAEEKGRARETEAELKAEVDKLSKTCHSQQQVSQSVWYFLRGLKCVGFCVGNLI